MKNTKCGQTFTQEEIRQDIIKGIRKYLEVGMFNKVYLLEQRLMKEYGMLPAEIEKEIYA